MKEELTKAIQKLYQVFSTYKIQGSLRDRSCDCCVTDEEIKALLSKPLNSIRVKEINYYMTSAITTFGDVNDYKHFLPRILELITVSDILDGFVTFEKLNYANWTSWNEDEVFAIKKFFQEFLISKLRKEITKLPELQDVITVCSRYLGIANVLKRWEDYLSVDFLMFIVDLKLDANQLYLEENDLLAFNKWLAQNLIMEKLEELYLRTKDKVEATRISITYTILNNERI